MLPLRPHSARSAGEAPELRLMKTTTRNLALQCNFPRQLSIEYENYNNAVIYIYCRLFFIVCLIFFFLLFTHSDLQLPVPNMSGPHPGDRGDSSDSGEERR